MMVLFVSQCEKKALARTRRVLDAFADRIGDNTWQTVITAEGLGAVRKLLRKSASKSTAVSCHWVRNRSRSDLLWIVGNRRKFNERGIVPVNYTESEMGHFIDKEKWQSLTVMKNAVVLAGLFHDFGKANLLFQAKLRGQREKVFEPVRHEWVSLRIFEAFVGDKTDEQWLAALADVGKDHTDCIIKDRAGDLGQNPLAKLPPFAELVGWLILSHHKLPMVPKWKNNLDKESPVEELVRWKMDLLEAWYKTELKVWWNSYNFYDDDAKTLYDGNWTFHDDGLPYKSAKWRLRAMKAADRALATIRQIAGKNLLHDELFTSHLSRLALMLADYSYSAKTDTTLEWRSPNYGVYANTSKEDKQLKQQLDEHLIGVSRTGLDIVTALPLLRDSLPTLTDNTFLQNTKESVPKFQWQVSAQKKAKELSESCVRQGFFGINMASTGTGKTLANAKIMYALADKEQDCRFTVALGLRTLTLQTGREYRRELQLKEDELAIAVGGSASKALFENEQLKMDAATEFSTGSESSNNFLDPDMFLDFQRGEVDHSLYNWTKIDDRAEKLLQAPVLVCTIDHLIPATDGTKGGKQIGPMLRLLTSDLVIDEPDDFGLEDLPALCRLVHWAGMLGSRVLLSTATMPPDLALAAFAAYQAGWAEYAKVNISNPTSVINCAWFDERERGGAVIKEISETEAYREAHDKYVEQRIKFLSDHATKKHKARIIENIVTQESLYKGFAQTILDGALQLHKDNYVEVNNRKISIGLVRMANINPLVAVAKELVQMDLPQECHLHLCVYHSHYPLAVRSHLESQLDTLLNRKGTWPPESLKQSINGNASKNHIVIVLASPVAEVGRDHDYDWAIIEPSSMRSIIQIAGRVLRHRDNHPKSDNILLINRNIRQLKGEKLCFNRPGFENDILKLEKHLLDEVLVENQYSNISAKPRVTRPKFKHLENLVALEHHALNKVLLSRPNSARLWWEEKIHWSGIIQKLKPFRDSRRDVPLYLIATDDGVDWQWKNEAVRPPKMGAMSGSGIIIVDEELPNLADRVSFLFDLNPNGIYETLTRDFDLISEKEASLRFGEMRLVSYKSDDINEYKYCVNLGIYQEVSR